MKVWILVLGDVVFVQRSGTALIFKDKSKGLKAIERYVAKRPCNRGKYRLVPMELTPRLEDQEKVIL